MPPPNSSVLMYSRHAEPVDPGAVRLLVSEIITEQYFGVAFGTVLIYHSILTFDKEIKYFWPNPRSPISILYFAIRYIGLLATISLVTRKPPPIFFGMQLRNSQIFKSIFSRKALQPVCIHAISITLLDEQTWELGLFSGWASSLSSLIMIWLIHYVLLIRVSALFNQNRNLSVTLKSLLCLGASAGIGILIYGSLIQSQNLSVVRLAEGVTYCDVNENLPPTMAIGARIVWATYGLILMVLALYKAVEYWKFSPRFKDFHLVHVLIRDQAVYFGVVIFLSIVRVVDTFIQESRPFASIVLIAAGNPTILCILGGQLLINLKDAGERGANGGLTHTPSDVTDIRFAEVGGDREHDSRHEGLV